MDHLFSCTGFDWDEHNIVKNIEKHHVSPQESEEIFFNKPLLIKDDLRHGHDESRFQALGRTNHNRLLFVVLTIRENLIRAISFRDMTKKERCIYYEAKNTLF